MEVTVFVELTMKRSSKSTDPAAELASGDRLDLQCRSLAIKYLVAACLLAVVGAFNSATVRAEVRVHGDVNALQIDASQSTISEVLSALGRDYNFQYRTQNALNVGINGTYSGPLKEVLARVLHGYNYVIKQDEATLEVVVIGRKGDRAVVPVEFTNALPAKSLAAQWRAASEEFKKSQKSTSGHE
jgi:hypothetical protein